MTAPKAGDSNDDDEVNVVDAVNTVNYILNKVVGIFEFEAADVNKDNHISVSDVTGTTAIILQQPLQAKDNIVMAKGMNVSDKNENYIVYSQPSKNAIDVALDVNSNYTAMQADITMAENVDDVNLKLDDAISSTHLLTSSKLDAHTLRVIVYSLSNSTFMDGRAIFTLTSKRVSILQMFSLTMLSLLMQMLRDMIWLLISIRQLPLLVFLVKARMLMW